MLVIDENAEAMSQMEPTHPWRKRRREGGRNGCGQVSIVRFLWLKADSTQRQTWSVSAKVDQDQTGPKPGIAACGDHPCNGADVPVRDQCRTSLRGASD
jgi:hypothetical protein